MGGMARPDSLIMVCQFVQCTLNVPICYLAVLTYDQNAQVSSVFAGYFHHR